MARRPVRDECSDEPAPRWRGKTIPLQPVADERSITAGLKGEVPGERIWTAELARHLRVEHGKICKYAKARGLLHRQRFGAIAARNWVSAETAMRIIAVARAEQGEPKLERRRRVSKKR